MGTESTYFPWVDLRDPDPDCALAKCSENHDREAAGGRFLLPNACGVTVRPGGREIRFIIDRDTIAPGSQEWRFIAEVADLLERCHVALNDQGKAALEHLDFVVFSRTPARSFADVGPNGFFYDVDEFRRSDGSLVGAPYAVSNIVHDANHIWIYDGGQTYTGNDAEIVCWQLQVDNADAFGLSPTEIGFLRGLIGDPAKVAVRIAANPFPVDALACSQLGKCQVTQQA